MTQSSQWLRLKSHLLRKRKGIKSRRPRFENLERRDLLAGVDDRGPDDADASAFSRDEEVDLFFGRINAENGDGILAKEGSLRNVGLDLANLHSDHIKHQEMTATTVGPFKFTSRNRKRPPATGARLRLAGGLALGLAAEGSAELLAVGPVPTLFTAVFADLIRVCGGPHVRTKLRVVRAPRQKCVQHALHVRTHVQVVTQCAAHQRHQVRSTPTRRDAPNK